MKKQVKLLLAVCSLGMLAGCASPKYNVTVYISPKFVETMKVYPSLELDIAGINANESPRIQNVSVDNYFEYDGELRKSLEKCTMTFSEDDITPKLMKKNNPVWKAFAAKESEQLLLIVNIPGSSKETSAKDDTRKLLIPLETPGLFGTSDRYFELQPTGILQLKKKPETYQRQPVDVAEKENNKK